MIKIGRKRLLLTKISKNDIFYLGDCIMIIKLELENIGPYTEKVILDFRINKKDKDSMDTIYTLPDGEMVTKVVGIIAGNAYGKSTILRALNSVGSFINNPMLNKEVNSYVDKIKEDEIRNYFKEWGVLSLIPVNKKNNSIGMINVEMYIDAINNEFSGYYLYTLKYDNNYLKNGVIEESLKFKKKYNSKMVKDILNIKNNTVSEIGHKIAYKSNYLNDLPDKLKDNLLEKITYYETFYNRFINESSTMGAENYIFPEEYLIDEIDKNRDLVKMFINLADGDIKNINVDKEDADNEKLYFEYDNYKLRYNHISTATKKICSIATNFYKSSRRGGVFLIDELDNSFNKNISDFIIKMYSTTIKNNTSQIIFTTNTSDILSSLRRDQIFIIQKDNNSNSIVKYLNFIDPSTNKKSRKDWSFVKAYNENVIKNFPNEKDVNNLIDYLKKNNT